MRITEQDRIVFEKIIEERSDLELLILWPKFFRSSSSDKIESQLLSPEVIVWTRLALSKNAIRNLLVQIYLDRVDNIAECIKRTFYRVEELWDRCGTCYFLLVEPNGFPVDHKTTSRLVQADDIMMVVNSICSPNSLHFIFNGNPFKYVNTLSLLLEFRHLLSMQHTSLKDYLVDSSSVLSLYGIRQANDLDYLTVSRDKIKFVKGIDEHGDDQKAFYSTPISDLIYNHSHHFYFCNIKFLSLHDLLFFKQTRYKQNGDIKDRIDIKLIRLFLQSSGGIRRDWISLRIWLILSLVRIKNKIQTYGF